MSWWRDQMQRWPATGHEFYAAAVTQFSAMHPDWSAEYVAFYAFRQVRDCLLFERQIKLDDIPEWNARGESRSYEEVQALPRDRSEERMAQARRDLELQQRAMAENEVDEPRRQYAGGRR